MTNPLQEQASLPSFSNIIPEKHIEPAIRETLAKNLADIESLLAPGKTFTWDNFMLPLEEINDRLAKVWSPVSHMHSVVESDVLHEVYNTCLPLLTAYHTQISQDVRLYQAVQSIADSSDFKTFTPAQVKVIENTLRDFKLSGVNLSTEKKKRFGEIDQELTTLTTQYAKNILDATHAWSLLITDASELAGLPEHALLQAKQRAEQTQQNGWLLTLDYPCYSAAIKYLENRELRRTLYEAYVTRASELGPNAGKFDNSSIMDAILGLRHEMANLVGFDNYAQYSLATKMAETPERVLHFLHDLIKQSKSAAQAEVQELFQFARERYQLDHLEPWDLSYYSEKLRQDKYDLSQEELKPYFPAPQVLSGLFTVVNKLFGLRITEKMGVDTWHEQVRYFSIDDANGNYVGGFYTDLYARPHKRDGAWMDDSRVRRYKANGEMQYPVAFLTCNFSPPVGDQPALLTQDEVETVFHEFGHCLHHLLTKMTYAPISGINGVAWDAVEFPSQMMEHWCWDKETVALISSHVETHERLPDALYQKMLAAKYFQSGLAMLRQVEFSLFDFRIHLEYDAAKGARIQTILDEVRAETAVIKPSAFNRFQHSFSHIFAGGYAAGYYSYKWAEVLSSDAFSLFEEKGIFDTTTSLSYLENILQVGGLREPMVSFVAFRGREPRIDALLRHSGLTV